MTIRELKNILQNYNEDLQIHVATDGSAEDSLFQIEPKLFREATIYETAEELVDSTVYNPMIDGPIVQTMEVVIIDLGDE
jgi:hypothetical protein